MNMISSVKLALISTPIWQPIRPSIHKLRQAVFDTVRNDGYTDDMKKKARCELRLEPVVHERLKSLAGQCDLSLNQLVEGILAWAGTNAHVGIPKPREDEPVIESDAESHVVWFGHDGTVRDSKGKIVDIDGPGQVCFLLDFRATRAMVDGWEVEHVE